MQNILIPTDFSRKSTDCLPALCAQYEGTSLRLVFVHFFKIADSISDLLMLSRRNKEYSYVSDGFYAACEKLRAEHPGLVIGIEFFYGSSLGNFRDFLEANEIDAVLDPVFCVLDKLNASSADPLPFIRKSGIALTQIATRTADAETAPVTPEELVLAEEV
ncbi:hypothetical protein [Pedobacter sp. JY14-1]|uniref:hypothetical protein n=1 Tax=Pedobacter sp. JY14-1 TaxID=3034151 RepID=UPI0023E2CCF1|nr:hypothetical protein [Pedobacter sp. JY14-1]